MKRKEKKKMGAGSIIFMALVYLFLYMPVFVIILFSFNKNNTNMVFDGFTLKWYLEVFQGDSLLKNFWLSIELALVSMVISVVLGTLATIGLYRYEFKLKKFINGLLYVPIVIPELVIGLASLASFSKMGMTMGFATMVFAHVTFCLPFVIITLRSRIANFDSSIEEAAMDLGANQWHTLKRVTIPMLTPGIISGALLSITLSIDDVIISYFVSGGRGYHVPYQGIRNGQRQDHNKCICHINFDDSRNSCDLPPCGGTWKVYIKAQGDKRHPQDRCTVIP